MRRLHGVDHVVDGAALERVNGRGPRIECRLWLNDRLGQHSYDPYLLADEVESEREWDTLHL